MAVAVGTSALHRAAASLPGPAPAGKRPPVATYRLQMGPGLRFEDARQVLPYLRELGISHVYASPIFCARSGSTHGYDVVNPLQLNPALGSQQEFDLLARDLKQNGLALILDIVPNHMAACAENPWWLDVLENGSSSSFARYFDIEWTAAPGLPHKLVIPVLGAPYGEVLENQELCLQIDREGFFVAYWDKRFPIDPKSYGLILLHGLRERLGPGNPALLELKGLLRTIERLPDRSESDPARTGQRQRDKAAVVRKLWSAYQNAPLREFIDRNLATFNGVKGQPESFDLLDRLLSAQAYAIVFWRSANESVNYRRFFDICDLVALRPEEPEVFLRTHALVRQLVREGKAQGVRVDHIDGLWDPAGYLRQLRESLDTAASATQNGRPAVFVEKVLLGDERLRSDWPVNGTTGYDFHNQVNGLFVDEGNLAKLDAFYRKFTGCQDSFPDIVRRQKHKVMRDLFHGELRRLALDCHVLGARTRYARDLGPGVLSDALAEVTASLRVYRTYVRSYDVAAEDRREIEAAVADARGRRTEVPDRAFEWLRSLLLLEFPRGEVRKEKWLHFVMRWQQFSGPVMAKGLEDTAMYVYNRLVSLNVIGGNGTPVTVDEFHAFNADRLRSWPLTLNTTSTHDTKRSEDVRARIDVLSELPDLWHASVARWSKWNEQFTTDVDRTAAPGRNEEMLLYQVLLGAWPLDPDEMPKFPERIREYMLKAARESKVHTSWTSVNTEYERALLAFVTGILTPSGGNRFLPDFLRLQRLVAQAGAVNSLAQSLLKIAAPGVPDIYQGTGLWDFSLVDPDNRRPVDFEKRTALLRGLKEGEWFDGAGSQLVEHWETGRIKLLLIERLLDCRRRDPELFIHGDYLPLRAAGPAARNVVAFARHAEGRWAIAVAPRFVAGALKGKSGLVCREMWKGTNLVLPPEAPAGFRNVLTAEHPECSAAAREKEIRIVDLLSRFPVALVEGIG